MNEKFPISVNNSCFLPQKSRNLLDFGDFHNLPGKSVSVPGFSQNLPAFYPENTRHGPARPARLKKTMSCGARNSKGLNHPHPTTNGIEFRLSQMSTVFLIPRCLFWSGKTIIGTETSDMITTYIDFSSFCLFLFENPPLPI